MRKLALSLVTGAVLMFAIVAGTAVGQSNQPPPPPPPGGFTPQTISPPCPPTGCPTNTPTITPTPTVTPTPAPTETATPVPIRLRLSMSLAHSTVWPLTQQSVNISATKRATVKIQVSFPNGDTVAHSARVGGSGKLAWSYTQPGSTITRKSQTAQVSARASLSGRHKAAARSYSISFDRLDVSAQPRTVSRGGAVNVWLHTYNYARSVWVVMQFTGGATQTVRGHVGPGGWWYTRYVVPRGIRTGHVTMKGYGALAHVTVSGQTSYTVK